MAATMKKSRVRKVQVDRQYLHEIAGALTGLASEIEAQAAGLKRGPIRIDGARTPERALKMLRLFRLKIEAARVAAE